MINKSTAFYFLLEYLLRFDDLIEAGCILI